MNTAILLVTTANLAISVTAGVLAYMALRKAKTEGEKARKKINGSLEGMRAALADLEV